ncbi:FtsK/SpoIIIE domain-containing protein [Dactylosporangium sp. AC04546]|uniref:FtsK/SpoIIIE domain-containing protein n=1 Tax=Dactylosporangium sp. AC04546 TaxID=2862460 RepID=UPI001EDF92ED|nr:FtsK/SpoIIIE domain-containing protein [Dactylosporangium sp. AC04546]WVK82550.1 FtsK/SpoIIIE domain-containing protein [Dactylosporangium sp. AC04546]
MDLLIDVRVARRDSTVALDRTVRVRTDPAGSVTELITAFLGSLDPADRPQQTTWAWLERTGQRLDPARPVGEQGLRCGDVLLLGPPEQPPVPPPTGEHRFELLVVAGPDAGAWLPLPPGEFVVGTDPGGDLVLDDPAAGRRHLHLGIGSHEVAATDLRSPAGTRIDGEPLAGTVTLSGGQLLRLGGTLIAVEEVPADPSVPAGPPPAVWLPAVPQPQKKRRFRRNHADPAVEFAAAMDRAEVDAAVKHRSVVRARRAELPSLAHLVRAAERREAPPRRPDDRDFLVLRLGTADRPSRLRFEQAATSGDFDPAHTDRITALRERYATDPDVPVEADLRALGALGATGPGRDSVLRSWVVQLATLVRPNDLALVVLCDPERAGPWAWTGWLPHTRTLTAAIAPGARTVAAEPEDRARVLALVEALLRQRRRGRHAIAEAFTPHVVVVLPDPEAVPGEALARLVEEGPRGGISLLVGAPTAGDLPPGVPAREGDGLRLTVADRVARALAATRDAAGGAAPRVAPLAEVLGLAEVTPSAIVKRWVPSTRDRGLAAPIGLGGTGPVTVDLRRDGPHGLVVGVAGSGRSWLLRSYLAALAATYPANRLTFVLVDEPGADTFAECAGLPHTVGVFAETDQHRARRVLISLNAEVRRREAVLRRHGVKDIGEMERKHPAAAPANLLIVVAEFATAPEEFVPGLRELARRGRATGVHLLLATASPHGVVDDDLRAEASLRIALRVEEEADSLEVLERPDAAHLSPLLPGRAFVRLSGGEPEPVQVAYGGVRSPAGRRALPTTITEVRFESGLDADAGAPVAADGDRTDLQRLAEAIAAAHREARVPDQPRPWQPPLAPTYTLDALDAAPGAFTAPIGMVDLPNSQARQIWQLDLEELGHLLIFGPAGAGKTTLLDTIAASFQRSYDAGALRVYRIGGEEALELLATIGSLVRERAALDEHHGARVLVLVDGHDPLLNDALTHVAAEGKAVGVHLVVATEQRSAVPTSLSRLMPGRIALRSAGRGLVEGTIELQVATAGTTVTTPAQRPRQLRLEV